MSGSRSRTLWGAVGLLGVSAALSVRQLGDFDLPWHLAMGRQIATTHELPSIDDLAYTRRPIQYSEFLGDLVLYFSEQVAGALGIQVLIALVVGALAFFVWWPRRNDGPIAWVTVSLMLAAMNPWLIARPATFGFLLLALTLLLIEAHRVAPRSRSGSVALFALIPLFMVWANVHASIFLGVVVVLGYAGYRLACRIFSSGRLAVVFPELDRVDSTRVAAVSLAAVFAATVNTAGPTLFLGPWRAQRDFSHVTEWVSPDANFLFLVEPATGALFLVLGGALIFGRETHGRAPRCFDLGLVVTAVAISATAVRLIAFAAILVAPVIMRRLAVFVRSTPLMNIASGASLSIVAVSMLVRTDVGLGVGFEARHFPEAGVQWIEANQPRGRLYNFMPFGGYLAWRLYPRHRVLIDGRSAFVHDPALTRRAHLSNFDAQAFDGLVNEFTIEWAITRSREGEHFGVPLAHDREFAMVYFDDTAAVYVRRKGPNSTLARNGYSVFRHLMPLSIPIQDILEGRRREEWAKDGALASKQAPRSPRAQVLDACGAIAATDRARFERALARLSELAPGHQAVRVLAQIWERRGDATHQISPL